MKSISPSLAGKLPKHYEAAYTEVKTSKNKLEAAVKNHAHALHKTVCYKPFFSTAEFEKLKNTHMSNLNRLFEQFEKEYKILFKQNKDLANSLKLLLDMSDKWGREWFDKQTWEKVQKAKEVLKLNEWVWVIDQDNEGLFYVKQILKKDAANVQTYKTKQGAEKASRSIYVDEPFG